MWQDFLTWNPAGWVIAVAWIAIAVVAGGASFKRLSGWPSRIGIAVSSILLLFGVFLFVGATAYQMEASRERKTFPMPGRLVDVGGYRIHIYCDGEAEPGAPTVIWIPGGYAPGMYSYPLQQAWIAGGGRACIIDRAGSGWSDAGPSPKSTKQIVNDFERTVAGAGEEGPFVLVGHSLGGMVAANWASRSALDIEGVVALDPTPQGAIAAGGHSRKSPWCGAPDQSTRMMMSMFGMGTLFPGLHPMNSDGWRERNASLEPIRLILKYFESQPRTMAMAQDGFRNVCNGGYEDIRTPGALGNLPLLAIVQPFEPDEETRKNAEKWSGVSDEQDWLNFVSASEADRREYPAYSTNGSLIFVPREYGHNFPVERPDYTVEHVRQFVASLGAGSGSPETDEGDAIAAGAEKVSP